MITMQKLGVWLAVAVLSVAFAPLAWAAGSSSATSATSAKPAAQTSNGQMPEELQKALQMPAGDARKKAVHDAAMNWVKSDPKAACEWVTVVAKGNDQEPFKSMMFDWGARDGAAAVAWVMGPNPKTRTALHYVVTAWAGTDGPAAAAWAAKVPKDVRKNAFNSVGEGWARSKDTPAAAAWAAKLTDDDDRHVAVNVVAGIWSQTTPALTKTPEVITAWVEKLPPADIKIAALQIVPFWAKKDAAKAKAWLDKLPLAAADKTEILNKK